MRKRNPSGFIFPQGNWPFVQASASIQLITNITNPVLATAFLHAGNFVAVYCQDFGGHNVVSANGGLSLTTQIQFQWGIVPATGTYSFSIPGLINTTEFFALVEILDTSAFTSSPGSNTSPMVMNPAQLSSCFAFTTLLNATGTAIVSTTAGNVKIIAAASASNGVIAVAAGTTIGATSWSSNLPQIQGAARA